MSTTELNVAQYSAPKRLMRGLLVTAGVGLLCFLVGLFIEPTRAWGGFLMGFTTYTTICLAGAVFVTVLSLSGARWATALRRIPEAMSVGLPYGLLLGLVLMGGVNSLYEWTHASVVDADQLLSDKAGYLNVPGFFIRMVVFFGLWIGLSRAIVAASRGQDSSDDPAAESLRLKWRAVWFLPVFAITFSLASIDWMQSLEPHWFSTIYGLITLSGMATSGLAVCIILVVYLRRSGHLRGIASRDHLDDLGKLVIGFSLFWGYIWYCQHMLIWYANMPEETPYYFIRRQGNWQLLSWINVTLNWAIPFFALMPKAARRNATILVRVAVIMLAGQALQMFMLIAPPLMGGPPSVGLWELGPLAGAFALAFWAALRSLGQAPLVPLRDPTLQDSLHHHC